MALAQALLGESTGVSGPREDLTVADAPAVEVMAGDRPVKVTNPDKVFFSARGETKLDLVNYYIAIGEAALVGVRDRPTVLKRFPHGAEGEPFFQKRVPKGAPSWVPTVNVTFPSGRDADELCPSHVAHLAWAANLGCIDLNPWPVRSSDVDHPDELRIDLDPQPGVQFSEVRQTALCVREVMEDHGIVAFPKTSGSRGMHIYARMRPEWTFHQMRRAALALGREVERRMPERVTTKWWKEERGEKVFVDYNQNARDRTVASVYSVRANPEGRVSCALQWDEVPDVEPADLTIATVPARVASTGDPGAAIDDVAQSLERLLELADRDERDGLGDAPWPPHFKKEAKEPSRVAPSRARKPD